MTKKLNILIFNEILNYLIFNNKSFQKIIEYSLLSKSIFKKIQNLLVSYEYNKFEFILTTDELVEYLKFNNNNNNNNNYNKKIIQYKDIEFIRFSNLGYQGISIYYTLNQFCKNLKKIFILDEIKAQFDISYDYTQNNKIKFKKLSMSWRIGAPPVSIKEIYRETFIESNYTLSKCHFTFDFIRKYNPTKIKISTTYMYFINLKYLNNLFISNNNKSNNKIKSIKFKNHKTPINFLNFLFNKEGNEIKSLTVEFDPNKINFEEKFYDFLIGNNNFKNNKIALKKLIINEYNSCCSTNEINWSNNPTYFIENILKLNKSINSIGFNIFQIKDYETLSPLKQISNIKKIYSNENSFQVIYEHCLENSNIKELIVELTSINPINFKNKILLPLKTITLFKTKLKQLSLYSVTFKFQNYNDYLKDSFNQELELLFKEILILKSIYFKIKIKK
ncbi:hypothetical protein DDB_G0283185 [Dictyostelium discoideum AX4]|uniref:Uncharacterized protein n=1 Tax=Dictyostelium discoideum TaxID=44689 RepID=Q54RD8_DICDI|nr:hypothetical protein DDB_G0283185 [Dictyostelium discoideum AX4]EAL65831.1 hypothetical protein DDB_G0283185 [Dictyostelium discoideum AX4]|eukprot:XP_639207.1 hypothetical protein DDB_G0283185 [Dictyostelium discoideum AX4]